MIIYSGSDDRLANMIRDYHIEAKKIAIPGDPLTWQATIKNSIKILYGIVLCAKDGSHQWLLENKSNFLSECAQLRTSSKKCDLNLLTTDMNLLEYNLNILTAEIKPVISNIYSVVRGDTSAPFSASSVLNQVVALTKTKKSDHSSETQNPLLILSKISPHLSKSHFFVERQELADISLKMENERKFFNLLQEAMKHNKKFLDELLSKRQHNISVLEQLLKTVPSADEDSHSLIGFAINYWNETIDDEKKQQEEKNELNADEKELLALALGEVKAVTTLSSYSSSPAASLATPTKKLLTMIP